MATLDADTYDVVVVGAGSAGCVVATRLAEAGHTVAVIEAGPRSRSPWVSVPAGMARLFFHDGLNWKYLGVPEPGLNGRRMYSPRGRLVGGTGAINGLVYMRGAAADFDGWAAAGNNGWAWADVVPHFRRLERWTAAAMLLPAVDAGRVRLISGAVARELVLADRRVTGVRVRRDDGEVVVAARREVVLCAGAFGSPLLLLRSGIGPGAEIAAAGRPVHHDLPGVGRNLRDHLAIHLLAEVRPGGSLNRSLSWPGLWWTGLGYLLHRRGWVAMGSSHAAAFVRSDPGLTAPDVQVSFRPYSFNFRAGGRLGFDPFPGVQMSGCLLQPDARGTVRLAGSPEDGTDAEIRYGYLSAETDLMRMRAIVAILRQIARTDPLRAEIVREVMPDPARTDAADTNGYVRDYAVSMFHPAGTCAMGTGREAVVGPDLRVHGLAGLSIADASIMPRIVRGNTNAATMMIADRAADLIQARGATDG